MTRIRVQTSSRRYDVLIGRGLLAEAGARIRKFLPARTSRVFVVTSSQVQRLWGAALGEWLRREDIAAVFLSFAGAEANKRLAVVETLAARMVRLGADRSSLVIALGGGVVGDVAGFLASIYMRGIPVVQIPTTLLAQVDAAIGGKTGVNLTSGKNLLGSFHQPLAVLVDPEVLSTLPEREFRSGLYEVLKCGVIRDPKLFRRFEDSESWMQESKSLEAAITAAVRVKADVVSNDEREGDLRRILNFGHTVGHALEAEGGYKRYRHGEAVAWGMVAATWISVALRLLLEEQGSRIIAAVLSLGVLPRVDAAPRAILKALSSDKKTVGGTTHWVLTRGVGKAEIVKDVPPEVVVEAIRELRTLSSRQKEYLA